MGDHEEKIEKSISQKGGRSRARKRYLAPFKKMKKIWIDLMSIEVIPGVMP